MRFDKTGLWSLTLSVPLVALLIGCASSGTCHRLTAERFPPRPGNHSILVTEGDCAQPYQVIAEVASRPHDARILDVVGRAEIEKMARDLGGDAVIRVARDTATREEIGYQIGRPLRRGTNFVERTTLTGVVVRFAENAPATDAGERNR
jgi:hypothetical protein